MTTSFAPATGRAIVRGRRGPLPPLALALCLAAPPLLLASWFKAALVWRTGAFFDTDDAMRAVQLRDWMAGQAWFDLAAHRMGPPEGLAMHWSRVVDVPLALLVHAFDLVLPTDLGERAARIAFPLALQAGLVAAMAYGARVLAGPRAVAPAALLIAFGVIGERQFQPGRIDHHAPQILLLTLMAATLLDSLAPDRARRAMLCGVMIAVSLAISLENLPFVAVLLAVLPGCWVLDGARHRAALRWLAGGLGTAAPAVFLATVPPWRYAVTSPDSYSAPHLAALLLAAGTLALLSTVDRDRDGVGPAACARRAGLAAGVAGAAAAVLVVAFPQCLAGPFAEVDPVVRRLWLDRVAEVQPLLVALRRSPGSTLVLVGPIALSSLAVLSAVFTTSGLARRRWVALAALVAVGIGGTAWAIRVADSVQPLALLGAAGLAARLFAWARRDGRNPAAIAAPYLVLLFGASTCWSLLPIGTAAERNLVAVAGPDCDAPEAIRPLDRLAPARVFAPIDAGPYLLAHTGLSVVAGPYHRNTAGDAAVLTGFGAAPDAAEAIVRGTGARYVLVCGAAPRSGPDDLRATLEAGHAPPWLRPVPVEGTPFKAYTVE